MATKRGTVLALGRAVSKESLRADLERYRQLALDLGASEAAIIPSSYVTVDERARLKCVLPRCVRAGGNPVLPPLRAGVGPGTPRP